MLDIKLLCPMIHTGRVQKSQKRVLRGGSWINNARNMRSAYRNANTPDNRNHNRGLRLAGALQQGKKARGSVNQYTVPFRVRPMVHGQNQGLECDSKQYANLPPLSRPYSKVPPQ